MSNYHQKLNDLGKLFDSRNNRERGLIAACIAAFVFSIWQFLLNEPITLSQKKLDSNMATLKTKINSVDKQYKILLDAKQVDPNRKLKARIELAQEHIDDLDKQLQVKMKGLISPTQMANILEQVLGQQSNLRFDRIQNLATQPLLVKSEDLNADNSNTQIQGNSAQTTQPLTTSPLTDIGVFKHGIEMEFSGSYLETLRYLHKLEKLPWNFYWDAILFDAEKYPTSTVIIRVHTLSLKEGWLGV